MGKVLKAGLWRLLKRLTVTIRLAVTVRFGKP